MQTRRRFAPCQYHVVCVVLTCCAVAVPRAGAQTSPTIPSGGSASTATTTSNSLPPEWRGGNGFSKLFDQTANDFRHLVSKDTGVIAAIGGVVALAGHAADGRSSSAMSGSARLHGVLGPGEIIGGAQTQAAAAVATYALGRVTSNATVTRIGADLIRAQIVTQTVTTMIKGAVGRTRPDGTQYSFPSGHASVTFATATVLQRNLGWKAGVPAYAVASYVAASRIQAKRHFLSDVTFGAALGIVAGRTVTIGRGSHRFSVAPSAVPGGAGVSFTWAGAR